MPEKVATHKRYYDTDEIKAPRLNKVMIGCGELGTTIANRTRRSLTIIDRDPKAFESLENPARHNLIVAEATTPEALEIFRTAGTLIITIRNKETAIFLGQYAKLISGVPRVFINSAEDSVSYKELKLKTFTKDTISKI